MLREATAFTGGPNGGGSCQAPLTKLHVDWALSFLALRRKRVVGVQVLEDMDFSMLRTVDSASWLVPSSRAVASGRP